MKSETTPGPSIAEVGGEKDSAGATLSWLKSSIDELLAEVPPPDAPGVTTRAAPSEEAGATAFIVREAITAPEREACYRLRYQVYVAEQGKRYPDADHAGRRLTDALDESGTVLAAYDEDRRLVGTVRVNFSDDPAFADAFGQKLDLERFAPFGAMRLSYASRLAVEPSRRRTAVFRELVIAAYRTGAPADVRISLCTCRPALVALFEHLGYEAYGPRFIDEGGGPQRALLLLTRDRAHLAKVSSPFLPFALRHPDDSQAREWLKLCVEARQSSRTLLRNPEPTCLPR